MRFLYTYLSKFSLELDEAIIYEKNTVIKSAILWGCRRGDVTSRLMVTAPVDLLSPENFGKNFGLILILHHVGVLMSVSCLKLLKLRSWTSGLFTHYVRVTASLCQAQIFFKENAIRYSRTKSSIMGCSRIERQAPLLTSLHTLSLKITCFFLGILPVPLDERTDEPYRKIFFLWLSVNINILSYANFLASSFVCWAASVSLPEH